MSDFTRGIKVYLDTQGYGTGIKELVAKSEQYRKKLTELQEAGKGNTKEAQKQETKLKNLQKTQDVYNAKLEETKRILENLSGATYNELFAVLNKLRNQLRDTKRDTEEYRQLLATLTQTEKELHRAHKASTVEIGCQGNIFGKAASWLNKYIGLISSAIAALTGLTVTVRKCRTAYNEQAEAEFDVMKYTGMTRDEVRELNKELGKLDTRTSRLALNALAADAGRLGTKGKDAIMDFVEAGDIINIALGEDLGDDAVKNIGKLAMMFGEDKTKGLRGAMLSSASAVNALGQNSTAAEPYLVDFTARMGGVAVQAKIAQANIMGYGSVLDQNMMQQEMAATAFQQLITKMFQTPATFARMLNMEVSDFSKLLNEDANEAILMFLDHLNQKGGFQELAPMFEKMGLNGQKAIGVISALAAKVDDVRVAQQLATEAYAEGQSVITEFDTKNGSPEARAEKARKDLRVLMVDLGEKLTPLLTKVHSTGSMLVRLLSTLVTFTIKHRTAIVSSVAALALYSIWITAVIEKKKLLTFWNNKVVASFVRVKAAVMSNPWAAVITGLTIVVGLIADYIRRTKEAAEKQTILDSVNKKAGEQYADEASKIDGLVAIIENENIALGVRNEKLNELKRIVPGYLGSLTEEGELINHNKAAIDAYLVAKEKEIRLKAAEDELTEQLKRKREVEKRLSEDDKAVSEAQSRYSAASYSNTSMYQGKLSTPGMQTLSRTNDYHLNDALGKLNQAKKVREKTQKELAAVNKAISDLCKEIESNSGTLLEDDPTTTTVVGGGGTPTSLESMKQVLQEQLNAKAAFYAKEKILLQERMAKGEISQDEYNMLLQKMEMEHADARMQIHQDYYDRLSGYIFDSEEERRKTLFDAQKNIEADEQASEEARLAMYTQYYANLEKIKKAGAKAETDDATRLEAEKQAELKVLEAYYKASLQYAEQHGMDTVELTEAYNAAKENVTEKYEKRKTEMENQEERKRQKQLNQYAVESAVERYRRELEELKEAKAKQLITEEEYEKAKRSMQLDYWSSQYQTYQDMAASAVEAVQQAEIDRVEAKYEALIAAAEGNDAEQERLENEKAQAKLDIEKKYADVNFGIKVSQIIADTAVAIMRAYADLGPVGGSVAAALLGVTGAAQLVSAKAERDKVKSMTLDGGSSSGSVSTAERVVQHADGKYDVIGIDDGRTYHVPYIGSVTGIVDRPALISENGAELIVNAEDLRRLQRHVDYPVVVGAINDARMGYVPLHSEGSYKRIDDNRPIVSGGSSSDETVALLREVLVLLRMLPTQIRAYVLQSDLNKAEELKNKSESPFTRGDKNHGTTH